MADLNHHLALLRSLFHDDTPSLSERWRHLCVLLDSWPDDLDRSVALDYARQNTAAWHQPHAPWSWWRSRAQRHLHQGGDNLWAPLLDFVAAWHRPINPEVDGLSSDQLADAEHRLGVSLPGALARWARIMGGCPMPPVVASPDLYEDGSPPSFLSLERLVLEGDRLILHDELDLFSGDRHATWSIHRDVFSDPDPEVTLYERADPTAPAQPQQHLTLSGFVLWMTILRTVLDHPRRTDLFGDAQAATNDQRPPRLPEAFVADPDMFPIQSWPARGAQPFFADDAIVIALNYSDQIYLTGAHTSGRNPFQPA